MPASSAHIVTYSPNHCQMMDLYHLEIYTCIHTVKFLNFPKPGNFAMIYLKLKQRGQTCKWNSKHRRPRVCTVCKDQSVQKLRIITVRHLFHNFPTFLDILQTCCNPIKSGPFIYQKDPKYRKDPEIPERPVNGSIHAQVSGGGRRFILILKNVK